MRAELVGEQPASGGGTHLLLQVPDSGGRLFSGSTCEPVAPERRDSPSALATATAASARARSSAARGSSSADSSKSTALAVSSAPESATCPFRAGRGWRQDVAHARAPATTEPLPDAAQRRGELARDDPDLVRGPLRDLREHLQVLVGEKLAVRVRLVDREKPAGWPAPRPRAEDRGLRLALRAQDGRLPSPSAVRICDCLTPSALRIAARRSRSARICFSIESCTDAGGSMALSSTRFTRMPQRPVASSRTPRSWLLIWSRPVSVCSRSRSR